MVAVKKSLPELKRLFFVQDRPKVLATGSQADLGDVQKMEHDVFTPQPLKGRLNANAT